MQLVLYASKNCGLCEDALAIIRHVLEAQVDGEASLTSTGITVEKVDIYTDKGLLIKYQNAIPVVKEIKSGRELGWPFDVAGFCKWLEQLL